MSISWCEKKLHQEKPPNLLLEPTLNLDPRLAIILAAAADLRCTIIVCSADALARGLLGLKALALRTVTL